MADLLLKSKVQKNKLILHLEKLKIQTRIIYPPIHRLIPYKNLDRKFKVSSIISDRGLWLPSSVTLTDKQISMISKNIHNFFN